MFNWAKQQLANVAGTQEPVYGPSAIQSVAVEAAKKPFTEIKRDDLKWKAQGGTCVETQTFYLMADNGNFGLAQVIYSSVVGIRTTAQFNSKIMYADASKPHQWCSSNLNNYDFSDDKTGFYADDCAVELSEDGSSYSIKSMTDSRAIVNITVKRDTPGFHVGETGKSLFGTDPSNPWGTMRHAFWPRCSVEGTYVTEDGPIDFKGRAMYVYALQGMKPHHMAARWNFVNFQGPTVSGVMMEFTTPPSYGETVVTVGGITRGNDILIAGADNKITHTKIVMDQDTKWPEPHEIECEWNGETADGKHVKAMIEGSLGKRADRVDVMAEVPGFVKQIVSTAAGTRPYIYMFLPRDEKVILKVQIGDEPEIVEEGHLFSEATFISGSD